MYHGILIEFIYSQKEARSHSFNTPLYKKLEKEYQENFVLPEINNRKIKLEEIKNTKGRHDSYKQLRTHQKQHDLIIKQKLKELSKKRNYK